MIPNPILKVLSILANHNVRHLLMGGQACVLYGAAEFSRDIDVRVSIDSDNLVRLSNALNELEAIRIAEPPHDWAYLSHGHAIHFRSAHPDSTDIRIDVMAVLRGLDPFEITWTRRSTLDVGGQTIELLGLPDLVRAKKTQREKDWPMIRRLLESNYAEHRGSPSAQQVDFWLLEMRTPNLLIEVAANHPEATNDRMAARPLLAFAKVGDALNLSKAMNSEAEAERQADREYWAPLRKELEEMRRNIRDTGTTE